MVQTQGALGRMTQADFSREKDKKAFCGGNPKYNFVESDFLLFANKRQFCS